MIIQNDEQNVLFTTSFPIFYVSLNLLKLQNEQSKYN